MKDYFTGQQINDKESDINDKLMFGLNQLTYFGGLALGIGGIRKLYGAADKKTQEFVKNTVKENLESIRINSGSFFEKIAMANRQSDISKKMSDNYTDSLLSSGIEKELNQIKKQIEYEVDKNAGLTDLEKDSLKQEMYEKQSREYLTLKNLSTNTAKSYLESSGIKYVSMDDADRFATEIYNEGEYSNKNNLTPYQRKIFRSLKGSGLFEETKMIKKADNSIELLLTEASGKVHNINLPRGFYTQDLLGNISNSLDNNQSVLKIENGKIVNPFYREDSQTKALGLNVVNKNGNLYSIDTATALELEIENLIKKGVAPHELVKQFNATKRELAVTASPVYGTPATLTIGVQNFNEFLKESKQTAESARTVFDEIGKTPNKKIVDTGLFIRFKKSLEKISKNPQHELFNAANEYLNDINKNKNTWDSVSKNVDDLDILYKKSEKNPLYKSLVNRFEKWNSSIIQRAGTGGYHSLLDPGEAFLRASDILFNTGSSSSISVFGVTHTFQLEDINRQNINESLNAPKSSGITAMTINGQNKLEQLAPRVNMVLMSSQVSQTFGIGQSGGTIIPPESGSQFLHRYVEKNNAKIELFRDPKNKKNLSVTIHNAVKGNTIVLVGDEASEFWKKFIKTNRAVKRNEQVQDHLKINNQEALIVKNFGRTKAEKNRRIYEDGILAFEKRIDTITGSKDLMAGAKGNFASLKYADAVETGLKPFIPQSSNLATVIRNMTDDLEKKNASAVEFDLYQDMVNKTYNKLVENKKQILNTTQLSNKELDRLKFKVNHRALSSFYGNKSNIEFNTIQNLLKAGKLYKKENRAILKPLVTGLKDARKHIRDLNIQLKTRKDNFNKEYIEVMTGGISKAEFGKFNNGFGNLATALSQPSMFYSQEKMFETLPDGTLKLNHNPNDSFILRDRHFSTLFGIKEDNQYKHLSMFDTKVLEVLEDTRKTNEIISLQMLKADRFDGKRPLIGANFFISIESTLPVSDFTLGDQFNKVKLNSRELLFLKLSNPYYYDLISYQLEQRNTWLVNHMKYLKTSLDVYDSRREFSNNELVKINKNPIEQYRKSGKKNMFLYNDLIQADRIVQRSAEQTGQEFFNLKQIIRQTIKTSKQLSTLNTGDHEYSKVEQIHKNLLTKLGSHSSYGINEIFEVQARELQDLVNSTTNLKPGQSAVLDLEEFFGYKPGFLGKNNKIAIQGMDPKEISDSISGKITIDGKTTNTVRIDPDSSTNIVTKLLSAREALESIKKIQQRSKNKKDPIFNKLINSIETTMFGPEGILAKHRNYIEKNSITDGSMLQKKAHEFSVEGMSSTVKSNVISNGLINSVVMNEETFIRKTLGDKIFKEAEDLLKYKKLKSHQSRIQKFIQSDKYTQLKEVMYDSNKSDLFEKELNSKENYETIKKTKLSKDSTEYKDITKTINDIKKQKRVLKYYKQNKDLIEYFNNDLWETTKIKNAESLEVYKSAKELATQIKEGRKYFVTALRHPTMSELNMTDLYVTIDKRVATGNVLMSPTDIEVRIQGDQDKDRVMIISKGVRHLLSNQMGISSFDKAIQEITSDIYGLRNSLFKVGNTTDNPQNFNLKALNYSSEKQMSNILNQNTIAKNLVFNNLDNVIEDQIKFVTKRFNLSSNESAQLREFINLNKETLLFNGEKQKQNVFYLVRLLTDQSQVNEFFKSGVKESFLFLRTPGAAGLELPIKDTKVLKFESNFGLDQYTVQKRKIAKEAKESYYNNWKNLVENINTETTDLVSKYTKSNSTGAKLQKQDAPTLYKTNTMMSFALSYVKKGVQYADHHRDVIDNIDTFLRDFTTAYGEVPLQSKHGTPSIVEGLQSTLNIIRRGGKYGEEAAQKLANLQFKVHLNPEELVFFNKTNSSNRIPYNAYKEGIHAQTNMFAKLFNSLAGTNTISYNNGTIKIDGNVNEAIQRININSAQNSSGFVSYEAYLKSAAESIQDQGAQQNIVSHVTTYGRNKKGSLGEFLYSGLIQSQKKMEGMSKFEGTVSMSPALAKNFGETVASLYKNSDTAAFMQGVEQGYDFIKGQQLSGEKISSLKFRELYRNLKVNEFRAGFAQITNLSENQIEQFNQLKGKGRKVAVQSMMTPEARNINFADAANISHTVSNFKGIGKSALVGTLIGMGINEIMSGFSVPDLAGDRGLGGEYWENKATKNSEKMLKPRPPMVEKVNPATRDSVLDIYELRKRQQSGNKIYRDRTLIEKNNVHQETLGVRIR